MKPCLLASTRRSLSGTSVSLASVIAAQGPTQRLHELTRDQLYSLSKSDRARGRLKKRLGGGRIPFSETTWGLRRERKQRIKAKAEATFLAEEADVELREQKRQSSVELTSSLPELTADTIEEAYLSLMAPSPVPQPSTSTLPAPIRADKTLVGMRERLALPSTLSHAKHGHLEQVIDALENDLKQVESSRAVLSDKASGKQSVDMGIATQTEWQGLLQQATTQALPRVVIRILTLMQRSGVAVDADVLAGVCQTFASRKDIDGAETLLQLAIEAGFSIDEHVHHAVLAAHVKAGDLVNAQFYLRALEKRGLTPLEESYQVIIDALLQRKRPSAAWNLFSHCRAVAHPTPSETMWASMIAACAPNSTFASPERALDLQQEMHDQQVSFGAQSYAALISVCAKRGAAEYYIKALSLLRDMIAAGFSPSKSTLETILEGAARQGDLARARWIFAQMVAAAENGDSSMAPSSAALTSILLAHAKFPINTPKLNVKQSSKAASATEQGSEDEFEDGALQFPGPMPRTRGEVLSSAENLFLKYARTLGIKGMPHEITEEEADAFLAAHGSDARLEVKAASDPEVGFAAMRADSRVVDAFLLVMRDMGPLSKSGLHLTRLYDVYRTIYARFGLAKPESATMLVLQACLQHRTHPRAVEHGSNVFTAYVKTLGPSILKLQPEDGTTPLAPYSAFTVRIWSHIICLLACADQLEPAMKLASQFAVLYPPSLMTHFARAVIASEERVPLAEISVASPDYAETSTFHAGPLRPPRLEFEQVKTLHQKLKDRGAEEGVRWLSSLLRQYTVATQYAERIIRGNDALPHGDRGPWHLIGKSIPASNEPSVLTGPPGDALQESRQRMLAGLGVQWQQVDHAPLTRGPLSQIEAEQQQNLHVVPPPPSRASVVAALEARRGSSRDTVRA